MLPELGELTVSGDSGARCPSAAAPAQPVSEVEDRPAVKFSNLSASQSLLEELAPRLRPEELAERWIVARGLSLLAPPRRCFRLCGELAPQEKMDMMAMAERGRRYSEVTPAVPCRVTRLDETFRQAAPQRAHSRGTLTHPKMLRAATRSTTHPG